MALPDLPLYHELTMQQTDSRNAETSRALVPDRKGGTAELEQAQLVAQKDDTKRPVEDEEYVLEAFGDISLSNIDFVPPPPSTLTPQKVAISNSKTTRRKPLTDTVSRRPLLGIAHNTSKRPLSASKSRRRDVRDLSFEGLVTTLKKSQLVEPEKSGPTLPEIRIHAPEPRRPINLKEFVAAAHDFDDFVARCSKSVAEDEEDNNGRSDLQRVRESPPLHGSGSMPKRLPIPQWENL